MTAADSGDESQGGAIDLTGEPSPKKQRVGERPLPKPYALFDDEGILWNRDSMKDGVGVCQGKMEGCETIYDVMQAAIKAHPNNLTAGKRRLVERHWDKIVDKETGKEREVEGWPSCGSMGSAVGFGRKAH